MDKKELIKAIHEKITITGTNKKQVEAVLIALNDVVHEQQEVFLRGLGKFKWVTKPARKARNPRTGEMIEVPERTVLTFRASK